MVRKGVNNCKTAVIVYDYAFINGGASKVAIKTALGLRKRGIKVIYFSAVGPVCPELSESDVKNVCLNMDDINTGKKVNAICNGIWNLRAKRELQKILYNLDRNQTIVHFHGWSKALSSSVVHVASSMKFKVFVTLHEYFSLCPNGGFYNYQKEAICCCRPMSLRCILANCDKRNYIQKMWRVCRQLVQDFVVRRNKHIIYISISDLNENIVRRYLSGKQFCRVKNPVEMGEKPIQDIGSNKGILYVGRLSEEKGIELFCEALEGLRERGLTVQGIVVGGGEYGNKLIEKYPEVEFVGWKNNEEVQRFMRTSRALVFPSKWYEGAPLTIVEAMSIGLPCIVSDCTSAAELIQDNCNGLIFRSNDIFSLEEKLIDILKDNTAERLHKNICGDFDRNEYLDETYISNLLYAYSL